MNLIRKRIKKNIRRNGTVWRSMTRKSWVLWLSLGFFTVAYFTAGGIVGLFVGDDVGGMAQGAAIPRNQLGWGRLRLQIQAAFLAAAVDRLALPFIHRHRTTLPGAARYNKQKMKRRRAIIISACH